MLFINVKPATQHYKKIICQIWESQQATGVGWRTYIVLFWGFFEKKKKKALFFVSSYCFFIELKSPTLS